MNKKLVLKLLKWAISINKQYGYRNPNVNPYFHMDSVNREAMKVLKKEGSNAFVKHVFTKPDGTQRFYAEMRGLYG